MQLLLHSKFIQAWLLQSYHVPFALNTHTHILSGMEHLLKEVIHLFIAQFADMTYYPVLMATSRDTDTRKHEHIPKAFQKMGLVKPQHGSLLREWKYTHEAENKLAGPC